MKMVVLLSLLPLALYLLVVQARRFAWRVE